MCSGIPFQFCDPLSIVTWRVGLYPHSEFARYSSLYGRHDFLTVDPANEVQFRKELSRHKNQYLETLSGRGNRD